MSHRIRSFVAPLALSVLAATQALTATAATVVFTPPPQLPHLTLLCFTRVLFAPGNNGTTFTRRCDAGEKPGSVKTVYVG